MTSNGGDQPVHPDSPRRRTRWWQKWLLLVGSLVLSLLAVEIGVRIAAYGANRGPSYQAYVGRGALLLCFSENPTGYLDLDLRDPAVRTELHRKYDPIKIDETYHYTPYGVIVPCGHKRMRPGQIRLKSADKIRVIAVGDSFTYGHGLKPGDPWPAQLETMLRSDGGDRLEVLNCGINGLELPAVARLLLEDLLPLGPDAVVYGWSLNDPVLSPEFMEANRELLDRMESEERHIAGEYASTGWNVVSGLRRYSAICDLVAVKANNLAVAREFPRWMNGRYGPANAQGWAQSQRLLRRMSEACGRKGAVLHVAIWPALKDLTTDYPFLPAHRAIAEACRQAGVPFIDLRESLQTYPEEALIWHPEDLHPSKLACRVAASAIRDHLHKHHAAWFVRQSESRPASGRPINTPATKPSSD